LSSDKKDNGLGETPEAEDVTGAAAPRVAETRTPDVPDDGIEDAEIVDELGPRAEGDWEEPGVDPYAVDPDEADAELEAGEIAWGDEADPAEPETVAPGVAEEARAEAAEAVEAEDDYLTPGVTAEDEIPEQPDAPWPGAAAGAAAAGAGIAAAAMAGSGSTGSGTASAGAAPYVAPAAPPAPPPPAPPQRSGGFAAAVLGGLIAAGIGFGVSEYANGGLGRMFGGTDPVEAALSAQGEKLAGLETRIGELASSVKAPDLSGIESQIGAIGTTVQTQMGDVAGQLEKVAGDLQTKLGDLDAKLAGVEERLTAVEKRPLAESSETAKAAFAAYERELNTLKGSLDSQQKSNADMAAQMAASAEAAKAEVKAAADEAQAMKAQAEAEAQQAAEREALASLDAAIARGIGYQAILDKLPAGTQLPEALSANAASGVASLDQLQEDFPAAARAALDASIKQTVSDDPVSRIGAFLKTQSGMRSLEPKPGDDPDAVLSRAEAAVDAGDLTTALAEVAKLPGDGQAAMAAWVAAATTRLSVTQAATSLSQTLLAQ
jgi:hypothetical protein